MIRLIEIKQNNFDIKRGFSRSKQKIMVIYVKRLECSHENKILLLSIMFPTKAQKVQR